MSIQNNRISSCALLCALAEKRQTEPPNKITVWLPIKARLPQGLRSRIANVTTHFPKIDHPRQLGPTPALVKKRRLDLLNWSAGLPAFGPEALIVQIAARPVSFIGWVDLAQNISQLANDADIVRLRHLLSASSGAAKQRAAYLLGLGKRDDASSLLPRELNSVAFGSNGPAHWDKTTNVNDHLVAPLMTANAKA